MGRNKDSLIALAEKLTGETCGNVLTKKDALKKIACFYAGEEVECNTVADALQCIAEHCSGGTSSGGASGGGTYANKLVLHGIKGSGYYQTNLYLDDINNFDGTTLNLYGGWAITNIEQKGSLQSNKYNGDMVMGAWISTDLKINSNNENVAVTQQESGFLLFDTSKNAPDTLTENESFIITIEWN